MPPAWRVRSTAARLRASGAVVAAARDDRRRKNGSEGLSVAAKANGA